MLFWLPVAILCCATAVVARMPNEWEAFGRYALLDQAAHALDFDRTALAPLAAARQAPVGSGAGPAASAGRDTVVASMKNLAYAPARIEVDAGTTIIWRNEDPLEHTVTARDTSWDSGMIAPGASWSRTFDRPGEFPFICTPHPFMTGVVVVRARPGQDP